MPKNYGPCSECKDMCYGDYYECGGFLCDGCAAEEEFMQDVNANSPYAEPPTKITVMAFQDGRVGVDMSKIRTVSRTGRTIIIAIGDDDFPIERIHLQYKSSDISDSDFEFALEQLVRYEEDRDL